MQRRLNAIISGGGFSATPVDLSGWDAKGEDLLSAQDTSLTGQSAQEAASEDVASSKLRSLLACNKSFKCTGVQIGDAALFYPAANRKSAPRRRGLATILGVDGTCVTFEPQCQTFKVARYRVRKKVEEKDAEEAE